MKSPRFLLAAMAAGLLSTATVASAQPPSADQVSVPPGAMSTGHGKLQAMFDNPEEFMMFQVQVHQATKGMSRDQRKAYRKQQIQQLRVMTQAQQTQWRQGLQAQWNALPDAQKNRIAQKVAARDARHQPSGPQGGPSGQGYMDPNSGPDSGSPR
jgi:isopentenyl diphosphate isomerase/L-lactate dehydrogenase-like FMN-dependent dehydrogenase